MKKLSKSKLAAWSALGALFGSAGQTSAAGFALYEQSGSGMGNAFAGVSSSAEDASTIFWNPAGMAKLAPGKHIAIAGYSINPNTKFSNGVSAAGLNRTDFGAMAAMLAIRPSFPTDILRWISTRPGILASALMFLSALPPSTTLIG
ncbi:MAG: outer membrane protein transport protein [Burkholderiales bacterium]